MRKRRSLIIALLIVGGMASSYLHAKPSDCGLTDIPVDQINASDARFSNAVFLVELKKSIDSTLNHHEDWLQYCRVGKKRLKTFEANWTAFKEHYDGDGKARIGIKKTDPRTHLPKYPTGLSNWENAKKKTDNKLSDYVDVDDETGDADFAPTDFTGRTGCVDAVDRAIPVWKSSLKYCDRIQKMRDILWALQVTLEGTDKLSLDAG